MGQQVSQSSKIFLLGFGIDNLRDKIKAGWFIFLGLSFFMISFMYFSRNTSGIFERWLMPFTYLTMSLIFLFKGLLMVFPYFILTPKVELNDQYLMLKLSVFTGRSILTWDDIKEIEFASYTVNVITESGKQTFRYKTGKNRSVEIKQAIREVAEKKGITIIDG
ncbi:hypothetical protein C9994_11865 [Marivirga lumbricoides]|uniref:DUF304 domain-containing protein n=1 Tax=Marivirga lumbricoides TaxID=1046115 RepID=A0A2T4DLP5_9BACT|nr:hypothetical protein C9994_11865 [Marivirga lumbricoides]